MALTLRGLVAMPGLDLTVWAGSEALDRPIGWVHVSELTDPTPFLEGGELLLTTGITLGHTDAEQKGYVDGLAAAGVAGLGFGTGLTHDRVPASLVAAAEAAGLPLVEVPRDTPFIAISKAVSRALAADQYAALTSTYEAQQALTRAALGSDGSGALVRELARRLDGWALLFDRAGVLRYAGPTSAGVHAAELSAEIDRLRGVRAPASSAFRVSGDEVVAQSLGSGTRIHGFLVAGRPSFTTTDRHITNTAAALLTLSLEQSQTLDVALKHLRSGLFHLLLAGELSVARRPIRDLWGGPPREPLRVVVAAGSAELRAAVVDLLDGEAAKLREPVFFAEVGDRLAVIVTDERPLLRWLHDLPERLNGLALGVSDQASFSALAAAYRQASRAADAGLRRGAGVLRFADLAADGLLGLVDEDRAQTFADALLGPLLRHDATGRGELVHSLRVWLEHHGQWDPASARLGVHRHTLRHRIRKVEQLLGRGLDAPSVRASLWLALQVQDAENQAGPGDNSVDPAP